MLHPVFIKCRITLFYVNVILHRTGYSTRILMVYFGWEGIVYKVYFIDLFVCVRTHSSSWSYRKGTNITWHISKVTHIEIILYRSFYFNVFVTFNITLLLCKVYTCTTEIHKYSMPCHNCTLLAITRMGVGLPTMYLSWEHR